MSRDELLQMVNNKIDNLKFAIKHYKTGLQMLDVSKQLLSTECTEEQLKRIENVVSKIRL